MKEASHGGGRPYSCSFVVAAAELAASFDPSVDPANLFFVQIAEEEATMV